MTIEDYIYELGWLKAKTNDEKALEAIAMAIRSLEAWELAKAEILKTQTYIMFEGDTDLYVERKDVLKIIDSHLKEVANDKRRSIQQN